MVYKTKKRINGKDYHYLVKSIRLPDSSVKKLSVMLKSPKESLSSLRKKYAEHFLKEEKKANTEFALKKFSKDHIFTKEKISKLESIRIDYKHLMRKLSKEHKKDIFDRFIANFTYESNALEGNSLTLKDVNIVLFENQVVKGKELREIYEVRNSRTVLDMLLKKKFKVNPKDIIRMHRILMKDIDTRTGYKKIPNYLFGKNVMTTLPENVEKEMKSLIEWYDNSKPSLHPLHLASLFHARFEKIHPFQDGNGRVGRFLMNTILVNEDYPPLIVRKSWRISYFSALEAHDKGHTDRIERFFLEKFKKTFRNFFEVYVKYAK